MKRIICFRGWLFFLFLFQFYACAMGSKEPGEEKAERELISRNKIEKATEYSASIFGGIKQKEMLVHERTFDTDGKLMTELKFIPDSILDCSIVHAYTNTGNLDSTIARNADGSLLYRVKITYDDTDRRKEFFFYLPDGTYKYRNVSVYASSGQLAERSWYWPDGFKAKNVFVYENKRKISDTEIGPKGEFRYTWNYSYNKAGLLVEAIQLYPDSLVSAKVIYNYDSAGQMTEEQHENRSEFQSRSVYSYNSNGLLVLRVDFSASGRPIAEHRFAYEFR